MSDVTSPEPVERITKRRRLEDSMLSKMQAPEAIRKALDETGGVIVAAQALVCREMYNGRNVLAPNSGPADADDRGYVPVERWIMSKTVAENPIAVEGEGVSLLLTPDGTVRLDHACEDMATQFALLGPYGREWPLTKVLDIGGVPWQPTFAREGEVEVPPIPAHVHPGYPNKDGVCCMSDGKLEAYFFPPVDGSTVYAGCIPEGPEKVITRLGLRQDVSRAQVRKALDKFGVDDELYSLLEVYPIEPNTSWTIQPGTLHAPGPWPTFEIQRPQDDAHILAWKLGQPIRGGSKMLNKIWSSNFRRDLRDADDVMDQTIHFEGSQDPKFKEKWFRPCEPVEEGFWGRRRRIFHHEFDGEGFEVLPGQSFECRARDEPYAALVWSGCGEVVAIHPERTFVTIPLKALAPDRSEFLVTPNTAVRLTNTSQTQVLFVYTVLPISKKSYFVAPQDWVD